MFLYCIPGQKIKLTRLLYVETLPELAVVISKPGSPFGPGVSPVPVQR